MDYGEIEVQSTEILFFIRDFHQTLITVLDTSLKILPKFRNDYL